MTPCNFLSYKVLQIIVTLLCLWPQPVLPPEHENIDYDSSASDDEELDIDYEEDEDVFKEPKVSKNI